MSDTLTISQLIQGCTPEVVSPLYRRIEAVVLDADFDLEDVDVNGIIMELAGTDIATLNYTETDELIYRHHAFAPEAR